MRPPKLKLVLVMPLRSLPALRLLFFYCFWSWDHSLFHLLGSTELNETSSKLTTTQIFFFAFSFIHVLSSRLPFCPYCRYCINCWNVKQAISVHLLLQRSDGCSSTGHILSSIERNPISKSRFLGHRTS